MNENPWEVESIMAFYFLKCPECEFDTQKETDFEEHAKENHPLSNSFFGKKRTRYEFDLFVPDVSLEEEGDENNELEEIEPETELNEENGEFTLFKNALYPGDPLGSCINIRDTYRRFKFSIVVNSQGFF